MKLFFLRRRHRWFFALRVILHVCLLASVQVRDVLGDEQLDQAKATNRREGDERDAVRTLGGSPAETSAPPAMRATAELQPANEIEGSTSPIAHHDGDDDDDETHDEESWHEALTVFESAMAILNGSSESGDRVRAYELLSQAAVLGHTTSQRMMAVAHLFGDTDARVEFAPLRAREILEPLAATGDAEAQLYLGFMHSFGLASLPASQAKALIYYTFSAAGGNHIAQMALGYRYYAGVGVAQSCETALDYYRRMAEVVERAARLPGSYHPARAAPAIVAISTVRLSDEYENPSGSTSVQLGNDLIQYYQFLADKGDVQAQVGLGHLHYQGGRGVQQDHKRALNYFKQAANTGSANAMAYLGKMYLEGGKAVPQNNETAFKYFSMAAEKGNAVGQAGLGTMFLYGKGIPKDRERALRYLTLAANQGFVDGQMELGNMFYYGLGVERNYKTALQYYKQASAQGHALAFYYIGMMYAQGVGVQQRSCPKAVDLFKAVAERDHSTLSLLSEAYTAYKAGGQRVDEALVRYAFLAELGYEQAQSNAAFILDRAEAPMFSERNTSYAWALSYWARAAAQGYVVARLKLGDYHYYGHGTAVDYAQSALHYRLAVETENNPQAMFNLAYMHEQGYGLPRDIYLAKRYYDLAAFTSVDAQIPVMLALVKLAIVYGMEHWNLSFHWDVQPLLVIEQSATAITSSMAYIFGPLWDIYVMATLGALFFLMAYLRRLL